MAKINCTIFIMDKVNYVELNSVKLNHSLNMFDFILFLKKSEM